MDNANKWNIISQTELIEQVKFIGEASMVVVRQIIERFSVSNTSYNRVEPTCSAERTVE